MPGAHDPAQPPTDDSGEILQLADAGLTGGSGWYGNTEWLTHKEDRE